MFFHSLNLFFRSLASFRHSVQNVIQSSHFPWRYTSMHTLNFKGIRVNPKSPQKNPPKSCKLFLDIVMYWIWNGRKFILKIALFQSYFVCLLAVFGKRSEQYLLNLLQLIISNENIATNQNRCDNYKPVNEMCCTSGWTMLLHMEHIA